MNALISRKAAIDAIYKNHMNGKEGVKQDVENLYGSAACFSETLQDAVESIEELPTVPAIPIPEGATNGDMIKAFFPCLEKYEYEEQHTHGIALAGNDNRVTWFANDWWNSPYRGDTKRNNV